MYRSEDEISPQMQAQLKRLSIHFHIYMDRFNALEALGYNEEQCNDVVLKYPKKIVPHIINIYPKLIKILSHQEILEFGIHYSDDALETLISSYNSLRKIFEHAHILLLSKNNTILRALVDNLVTLTEVIKLSAEDICKLSSHAQADKKIMTVVNCFPIIIERLKYHPAPLVSILMQKDGEAKLIRLIKGEPFPIEGYPSALISALQSYMKTDIECGMTTVSIQEKFNFTLFNKLIRFGEVKRSDGAQKSQYQLTIYNRKLLAQWLSAKGIPFVVENSEVLQTTPLPSLNNNNAEVIDLYDSPIDEQNNYINDPIDLQELKRLEEGELIDFPFLEENSVADGYQPCVIIQNFSTNNYNFFNTGNPYIAQPQNHSIINNNNTAPLIQNLSVPEDPSSDWTRPG